VCAALKEVVVKKDVGGQEMAVMVDKNFNNGNSGEFLIWPAGLDNIYMCTKLAQQISVMFLDDRYLSYQFKNEYPAKMFDYSNTTDRYFNSAVISFHNSVSGSEISCIVSTYQSSSFNCHELLVLRILLLVSRDHLF